MNKHITLILGAVMIASMLTSCGANASANTPTAMTENKEDSVPEIDSESEDSLKDAIVAQVEDVDGTKLIVKTGTLTDDWEFEATGTLIEIRTDSDTSVRFGRYRQGQKRQEGESRPEKGSRPEGETRQEKRNRPEGDNKTRKDNRGQASVSAGDIVAITMKDDTTASHIRILVRTDESTELPKTTNSAANNL